MKKLLLTLTSIMMMLAAQAQLTEIYGPYYGGSLFVNKGNLYNSDDYRADSFQKYQLTPNFAGQLELGYLFENGFSIAGCVQFATCNQKYKGADPYYAFTLTANTKSSFIKLPFIISHQTRNDKLLKFIYSVGFYYALTLGYSDQYTIDAIDPASADFTTSISKGLMTTTNSLTKDKTSYAIRDNIFNTHGLGALAGAGISYRFKEKVEFIAQFRTEMHLTNVENTSENVVSPTDGTPGFPQYKNLYGNYAKYMSVPDNNYRRAQTRPINMGINLGLRFYKFRTI